MSATNRGAIRRENDYYITPDKTIRAFLDNFDFLPGKILEPCAGDGSIIRAIKSSNSDLDIDAIELMSNQEENLKKSGATKVEIRDFLTVKDLSEYETIITNPPFSLAQAIIEHCFEVAKPDTDVIMLLRLGFLESERRREFWKKYPLTQLYALVNRPSFTGHGTDACAYGWFVWSKHRCPLVKVI